MKSEWPDWDVYKKGQCKCVYCGLDGLGDFRIFQQLAIDHLIPKNANGPDFLENKVVSCTRCNILKGRYNPAKKQLPEDIAGDLELFKPWISSQREEFIEAVKGEIQGKREEEEADYKTMKKEIELERTQP